MSAFPSSTATSC
jgi:hypothetical protein